MLDDDAPNRGLIVSLIGMLREKPESHPLEEPTCRGPLEEPTCRGPLEEPTCRGPLEWDQVSVFKGRPEMKRIEGGLYDGEKSENEAGSNFVKRDMVTEKSESPSYSPNETTCNGSHSPNETTCNGSHRAAVIQFLILQDLHGMLNLLGDGSCMLVYDTLCLVASILRGPFGQSARPVSSHVSDEVKELPVTWLLEVSRALLDN